MPPVEIGMPPNLAVGGKMPSTEPQWFRAYLETGYIPDLPGGHFIDGKIVSGDGGERMEIVDPGRGRAFMTVPTAGAAEVDMAVASARRGFERWRHTPPAERGRVLARMAALMLRDIEPLAFRRDHHGRQDLR